MKHTFLRPAAFLLAAGLLFCTLFAPAASADEQKDRLSGAVSSACTAFSASITFSGSPEMTISPPRFTTCT